MGGLAGHRAFLISLWQPILEPRYVLPSVAGVCLLLAISLTMLPRTARMLGTAVLVVVFMAASIRTIVHQPDPDWRSIVSYLDRNMTDGQRVATIGESYRGANALEYYSRALGGDRRHLSHELGLSTPSTGDHREVEHRATVIGAEARSGRGLWLLVWGEGAAGAPVSWPATLAACTADQRLSPGGTVLVYFVSGCDD